MEHWKAAVIIPVFNMRPDLFRACLWAACRQKYPCDVLVFDDQSTDRRMIQMGMNILKMADKQAERRGKFRPRYSYLRSQDYTKKQYPTAGHVFNEAVQYVKAQGYEWHCIIGGDDIILPNFAINCLALAMRHDHSKLAGTSSRTVIQIDTDKKFRFPFMFGEKRYAGSPQWWKTSLMSAYQYPEDREHPMTDWGIEGWVKAQGWEVIAHDEYDYVYVWHKDQLSAQIHADKGMLDYIAFSDHLSGKRFIPEIHEYLLQMGEQKT